jgi:hypothetical protein
VSQPANVYQRRRLTALAVVVGVLLIAIVLIGSGGGDPPQRTAAKDRKPEEIQLPRGGRTILPDFRVVAYYGAPQSRELGALGIGSPQGATRRLEKQAKAYEREGQPPVLPALELITVIANADPGEDGMYRARQTDAVIRRYLRAARKAKALLLLDIQPGRSDFFTEATRLKKWLKEPDVSLALDPEWRVSEGEIPGQIIGHVGAREVNATSAWLAQLVERYKLPQKLLVVHQFTDDMVPEAELKDREGLALVLNVDGFGDQPNKKSKYKGFTRQAPDAIHGFKLFYSEDTNLMTPRQVLRLRPPPSLVVYE